MNRLDLIDTLKGETGVSKHVVSAVVNNIPFETSRALAGGTGLKAENVKRRSIVLAIFLWGVICASCTSQSRPSDVTLIENFQKNKDQYQALSKIFERNPSLRSVHVRSLISDNSDQLGIQEADIMTYRGLCEQLGVNILIKRGTKEVWLVIYDSHPFPPGGTYKGYALMKEAPAGQVDDLDKHWSRMKQGATIKTFTVYRRIEGNWYLFLDFED